MAFAARVTLSLTWQIIGIVFYQSLAYTAMSIQTVIYSLDTASYILDGGTVGVATVLWH